MAQIGEVPSFNVPRMSFLMRDLPKFSNQDRCNLRQVLLLPFVTTPRMTNIVDRNIINDEKGKWRQNNGVDL